MESVEQELKELIIKRYKSIRKFSQKIDVPYNTIYTIIINKGVNTASADTIMKICAELDINMKKLIIDGVIENSINELTTDMKEILYYYNMLNEKWKKEAIKRMKELIILNDNIKKDD